MTMATTCRAGLCVLAAIGALLTQTGCYTPRAWEAATRPASHYAGVAGEELPAKPKRGDTRTPVVRYNYTEDVSTYWAVPVDADGQVAWPLRFTGRAKSAAGIAAELSPEQRRAVEAFRFPDKALRSAGWFVAYERNDLTECEDMQPLPGTRVVAIGLNAAGRQVPLEDRWTYSTTRPAEEAVVAVLLMPAERRRTPGERAVAVVATAIITPILIVADGMVLTFYVAPLGVAMAINGPL